MEALYDDSINWYKASVIQANPGGTYGVRYDDGDFRENVPLHELRRILAPAVKSSKIPVESADGNQTFSKESAEFSENVQNIAPKSARGSYKSSGIGTPSVPSPTTSPPASSVSAARVRDEHSEILLAAARADVAAGLGRQRRLEGQKKEAERARAEAEERERSALETGLAAMERAEAAEALLRQRDAELRRLSNQQVQDGSNSMILPSSSSFDDNEVSEATVKALLHKNPAIFQALLSMARSSVGDEDSDISSRRSSVNNVDLAQAQILSEFITRIVFAAMVPSDDSAKDSKATNEHQLNKSLQLANMTLKLAGESWAFLRERTEAMLDLQVAKAKYLTSSPSALSGGLQNQQERQESVLSLPQKHVFAPPLSLALKSTGKISTGHELVRTRTIDDSLTSASFETAADEINAQSISTATGTKDLRGYSSAALADSKMKPSSKVDNLPSNLSRRDTKNPDPALAIGPKDRADIEKRRKLPSSSSTSQSKSGGGISASTLATLKSASKHAHRIVRSKTPVGGRSTNSSSSSSPPLPPLPPSSSLIISPPPNSPPADVAALAADSNKAALVALENSKKLVSSVVAESSGGENCIVAPSTDVIDAKQKSQAVREGKSIMSRGSYSANDVLSKESDSQSSDVSAGSSKSIFSVATAPSSSLADARLRLRSRGANTGSLADRIAAWKNVSSSLSGSVSSTSSLSSSSVGKVLSPVTPPSGAAPTPAPTPTSVAKPRLSKPLSTISKKNSAPPTSPLKSSSSGSPHHRSASPMSKRSASPMRPPTISPPPSMAATSVPQEVPSMSAKTSIMHIHAEKSLETSQTDGMTDQVTTSANQSNPISPQSSPYSLPVGSDERIGRRTSWESLQSKVDAAVALAASSRGGKSKPQEAKILHDSDRDHGDLETNVAELQQKTKKNTEGEKDKKEAEVGMEVAIAETCNYQLRGEDIPPRDNESFSLTLNGTQHTSVTVPEAVPTNYAEHVAPKSESDDMSIETKKEHSSKIKSESAIPLEGVPPIPSIANTATSTGTNQSLSPSAKIEVKETLQANNTENGTEASKSVGVAGGGDNSKKPSEIAIKLWAAPKYHKNRQHCSNTSTGKWSSDAKGVEEEERASSPIAERVRQWKQATSNGSLASSKNCDNNNSNEGEQGPRKSYSPSSSHHRNNGPNGQRSLSAGQVRQMAERTESPSSLSAISQDKKKQAAAAFASASSSSPSPGRGRFPRGSSPNPNNWSGGFRAHPGSSNQAGVVNTNKKEDNVPSRSANSSPLRGRGVTSNHAEKTVETLPDVDSTPDIEGGQHQSKQRKGRQTSPLIERKLAQWKATSASSDDVNAMKRSPSPTQPDGASDTVSSAAGPWRQNRVLSASGINKRVSESPGRRAGSPVSERVKQWKQQAAHAVKQAAQSAQDNKKLNGKKGGNTQQRAASASKLPPQGAGFSGAREASPLANRSSSTRLIKNGIGEQRFVAPTVLRRRATSPSPQRALLPLKGSTEAAARSTGNGTNEKKDIESKKDKKSEVGGDSSKAPLVTAAVVTDSGGTILTTASTLVPRPPSPALLASKQISSMTPQSTNKEGTTGISDTRGRRGSSNSVLGSSGGLRTVRGTGDNGNGLPSGLSFIQVRISFLEAGYSSNHYTPNLNFILLLLFNSRKQFALETV